MKLNFTLAAAGFFLAAATAAQAGPQVFVSFGGGGGCVQQPVYCAPRTVYYQQPFYGPSVSVVTVNQGARNCNTGFSNQQVVTYGAPVYRVAQPVYTTQPVQVYQGNSFGWRR
jgi:hypothetical protein